MRTRPFLILPLVMPAALAAPVPKANTAPVEWYAAEALAKLPFADADNIPKEWEGKGDGPKTGLVSLAVSLPKTVYAVGEPVEPLFVLRNRTDRPLGFGCLFDFTGDTVGVWNSANVEVRDTKAGEVVGPGGTKTSAQFAGDGPTLSPKGYYAASGNIASRSDNRSLPPGEYELDWRYGWAKSNAVKFTVADRPFRGTPAYKSVRLLRVTETDERGELKKAQEVERDASTVWNDAGVAGTDPMSAAVSLGTGQLGRYYPSLRRLPETVGPIAAGVKWTSRGDEESFTLTLSVTHKEAKVVIPGDPHVYLLIETDAESEAHPLRALADRLRRPDRVLGDDHPFELTVKLPKDWADEANAPGPARVAVLVASKALDSGFGRGEALKEVADSPNRVEFAVRTSWRSLTLSKPAVDRRKRDR